MRIALVLALLAGLGTLASATEADDEVSERFVVVLGSFTDFGAAHRRAVTLGHASGTPFSLEGKIYDKARGLILPDDAADAMYAGEYLLRRYNTRPMTEDGGDVEYLSIERGEAYDGLHGGEYVIVGGIYDDAGAAKRALSRFQRFASGGFVQRTQMYMGCMH